MALESGSYINDLVITNPASSDPKSQGDDHFQLLKKTIKECLNGFTGGILLTATETGTASAHVLTPTTALVGYTTGLMLLYRPVNAGTGALTVNVSALGAKSVKLSNGSDPTSGDIQANQPVFMMYDGTNFVLLGGSAFLSKTGNQALNGNLQVTGVLQVNGASTLTGDIGGTGGDKKANRGGETYAGTHDFTGAAAITVPTPTAITHAVTKAYADALSVAAGNVPVGGATGEYLKKNSATNYDTAWSALTVADVQVFAASGTWTKPSGATFVQVQAIGGGGGGGSGRRGAAGGRRGGGGGGGGGGLAIGFFRASELAATETITIGAGGSVGAAIAVNATNGNAGGTGGTSSFGAFVLALGGNGGGGGTTAATTVVTGGGAAATIAATGTTGGAFGGTSATAGVATTQTLATGGGSGSSTDAGGAAVAGSAGGASGSGANLLAGGVAGTVGSVGGTGNTPSYFSGGTGGGGGHLANDTSTGSAGGPGRRGGGGGGGSCSADGFASGAGGLGGDGYIVVTSW